MEARTTKARSHVVLADLGHSKVSLDRIFAVVAGLFLIVLPIPHTVTLRLSALAFLAIAAAIFARRGDTPPIPLKVPLMLWFGLASLSLLWAVSASYTLGEIRTEILYSVLAFVIFFSQARTVERVEQWVRSLVLIILAMSVVVVVLQYLHIDTDYPAAIYPGVGSYTAFAVTVFPYLLLTVLFSPRLSWMLRGVLWLVIVLVVVTEAITHNCIFWFALGGATMVYAALSAAREVDAYRRRMLAVTVVALPILIMVAVTIVHAERFGIPVDTTSVLDWLTYRDPRLQLWSLVWDRFLLHPWVGLGFGLRTLNYAYPDLQQINIVFWHPHNLVLSYAIGMGVLGVAVLVLLFAAIVRELWQLYRDPNPSISRLGIAGLAMVTGVLIRNMTDGFFYRENSLLFWSLLGMTLGCAAYSRRRHLPGRTSS
ncbi:MAG: O-antigen ligase family protein [Sulfurifustis sp.]